MIKQEQERLLNNPAVKERILKLIDDTKAYHQAISTFKLTTHTGTHKGFPWVTDAELRKNNLFWEDGRLIPGSHRSS
jgi:hypothetical protein